MRFLLPFISTLARPSTFYSDFHLGLAEAARALGHETLRFDIADGAQASATERDALYRTLAANPCDAVIDLCCWGLGLSRISVWDGTDDGDPLFDSLDMAYVGLLLDQPWFQPLPGVRSSRLYAGVPDRNNFSDIPLIYPELQLSGTAFVPPAVRIANDRALPWDKRDLDVLFIGNLQHAALALTMAPARAWPPGCAALCEATISRACAHPAGPLYPVMLAAASELGLATGDAVEAPMALDVLRAVAPYLRARGRLDAVRAAAASLAAVHVMGLGWDAIELPANVVRHPATTDYDGLFAMAGRARLCLDVSSYPGGANDRVFSYSMSGAVCLSNTAGYLGEVYGQSGGVQFYAPAEPEHLAASIAALLAAPQRLRDQGEAGRAVTLATQNWRQRLEAILDCIAARPAAKTKS